MPVRASCACLLAATSALVLPVSADAHRHGKRPEAGTTIVRPSRSSNMARKRRHQRKHPRAAKTASVVARVAHAAGDPGVTIADFQFSPSSTTIHVGDTVTWTNSGPSAHTATASDGSFNTGTLQKGQSGSHTFSQTGTFSYDCTIHPFMKGTIVVLASSSGSGSGSSGASSSGSSGSGSGSSSGSGGSTSQASTPSAGGGSLPMTGFDALAALIMGLALLGVGFAVRRGALR